MFTDGSSKGYTVVLSEGKVEKMMLDCTSAQLAKLKALLLVLSLFPEEPCNIYVSNIILPLETAAYVAPVSPICSCLLQVQALLWRRREPIYVGHIRGHSGLPGLLAEGNAAADLYTRPQFVAVALDSYDLALQLHRKYHINSQSLRHRTGCTKEQAVQRVTQCPSCALLIPSPSLGVNPRGLMPNDIWKMDVTHAPSFGKLKYVHVSIDTYSGLIFASAHSGERLKDVKSHCLQAFAFMNVPRQIKTDDGPAYNQQNISTLLCLL